MNDPDFVRVQRFVASRLNGGVETSNGLDDDVDNTSIHEPAELNR